MVEVSTRRDFLKGFYFGAATSAFQVEGGDLSPEIPSDWRRWEQITLPPDWRSDRSADHYNRYEEDFSLLRKLGHNAHRLSLEWARIEPDLGVINQKKVEHYKNVLKALKEEGMTSFLTLHHFTNPTWFADMGGWENPKAVKYFEEFARISAVEFGEDVGFWTTINEPSAYVMFAYLQGKFPPEKKDNLAALRAYVNMVRAHKRAYKAIHEETSTSKVGMANVVVDYDAFHSNPLLRAPEKGWARLSRVMNHMFYRLTPRTHDYLGLNYYMHLEFALTLGLPPIRLVDPVSLGREVSNMGSESGWEIYPRGLLSVLKDMKRYNLPIVVTENGIATKNEEQRTRFIVAHLYYTQKAIEQGVNLIGYLYWSALQCMELHRGYDPDFGLIAVDPRTKERTPRPAAYVLKEIIENRGIPANLQWMTTSFDR